MLPQQTWGRRIAAGVGNGRASLSLPAPLRLKPLVLRVRVPPLFNNTSRVLKGKEREISAAVNFRLHAVYRTRSLPSPLKPGSAPACSPVGPLLRQAASTISVPPHAASASLTAAMPRPKVKPQDRQRSAKACDACKASKKRCDANQPCRLCLKKGTQDTCTYTPTARDRNNRRSESKSSQANSIAVATNVSPVDFGSELPIPSSQRPSARLGDRSPSSQDVEVDDAVDDADSETDYLPDSRNSVERTDQQQSLMLQSSSGDKGI